MHSSCSENMTGISLQQCTVRYSTVRPPLELVVMVKKIMPNCKQLVHALPMTLVTLLMVGNGWFFLA